MSEVFVSYRDADSGWAVLLDRELSRRFGSERVFRASRSVRPGQDFSDEILRSLRASSVVVVIIGAGWSTGTHPNGRRRVDDEQDWVRREIAEAFQAGIPVVPVLVGDAAPPVATDLPADMARLARCQYLRLHQRSDEHDIDRIVAELTGLASRRARGRMEAKPRLHQASA